MTEPSYKNKIASLIAKIKAVKHIEIILAVVLAIIVLTVYFIISSSSDDSSIEETPMSDNTNSGISMTEDVEKRLKTILCEIDGAGDVSVMICYASGVETVYATTTSNTVNTSNGQSGGSSLTTSTETPIIITNAGQSELIKVKEIMPQIVGVVVVAQGADNIKTRLALLSATATALAVDANIIEVFTKN